MDYAITVRGESAGTLAAALPVQDLVNAGVPLADVQRLRGELQEVAREHKDATASKQQFDSLAYITQHGQQEY